jgi:hypothetical protein
MTREGVGASYIGPEKNGSLQGDRCWVFADEGSCLHVRWTSGKHEGAFGILREGDLAVDQTPVEDEFGFETPQQGVSVNCAKVFDRGGELALFEALQAEGHLDDLEERASLAVEGLRHWMDTDPTWAHIREAVGDGADRVVKSAIAAALMAVTEE